MRYYENPDQNTYLSNPGYSFVTIGFADDEQAMMKAHIMMTDGKVDATILSAGARVDVVFHPYFLGSPYVTRVTLLSNFDSSIFA